LEYKADVNAKTINEKKRPLQFAIDAFDPELIELLIDHESNSYRTILMLKT